MSGGHSDAWHEQCERPFDGQKRCKECGAVKPWPSAFLRRQKCNECSDRHAVYVKRWRVDRAWRWHQRRASPCAVAVYPALP